MTAVRYRTADVDGFSIFYREAGAADAPKLLLLHGFPSASHMFRDLIALLSDRFHTVAPDLPGFGKSDMPGPDASGAFRYTFERIAEYDRPLHRSHRVRSLRRLCLRLRRADGLPPGRETSGPDRRHHLAERQCL
jgi:pimeloyl-ACP methyl ester carboxylesterase